MVTKAQLGALGNHEFEKAVDSGMRLVFTGATRALRALAL
ncbi:hypothetical protein [Polaromonas sp. CG9_12]|nr:hypothetical protein [Polaromonas sp. CG9_12]